MILENGGWNDVTGSSYWARYRTWLATRKSFSVEIDEWRHDMASFTFRDDRFANCITLNHAILVNFNCSVRPANDMPMLIPGQWSHTDILLSPPSPPPNDMVCFIMHKHRHVHNPNIYTFICLGAMNLKHLLCTSWIGCVPIHYDKVHKR